MTANKLLFDKNQSNVLLKIRRTVNKYLKTNIQSSKGFLTVVDDQIQDLQLEFSLDIIPNNFNFSTSERPSRISFKSISYQKGNQNLSFIKGYLSIDNIIKIVELEVSLVFTDDANEYENAFIEITGTIDRKDFGWTLQEYKNWKDFPLNQKINLVANLDFTNFTEYK